MKRLERFIIKLFKKQKNDEARKGYSVWIWWKHNFEYIDILKSTFISKNIPKKSLLFEKQVKKVSIASELEDSSPEIYLKHSLSIVRKKSVVLVINTTKTWEKIERSLCTKTLCYDVGVVRTSFCVRGISEQTS